MRWGCDLETLHYGFDDDVSIHCGKPTSPHQLVPIRIGRPCFKISVASCKLLPHVSNLVSLNKAMSSTP